MKNLFHKNREISAQQGRMVEKQAPLDHLGPAHEWRRIFAEIGVRSWRYAGLMAGCGNNEIGIR